MREIQRKFKLDALPAEISSLRGTRIKQAFITVQPHVEVKVRTMNDQGFLTVKGDSGIHRERFTFNIPSESADSILANFIQGSAIEKTRYTLTLDKLKWEIDVFHDQNEGLILAEIETEDIVIPPAHWNAIEVSLDSRYRNSYLFEYPFNSGLEDK